MSWIVAAVSNDLISGKRGATLARSPFKLFTSDGVRRPLASLMRLEVSVTN